MIPPLPKAPELEGELAKTTALDGEAWDKRRRHLTRFLTRCGDHPMLYNSSVMLNFLTETDRGALSDAITRKMAGLRRREGMASAEVEACGPNASWFGQMFGSARTVSSVLKDEDPQYLQVIEYTKKIEDQIVGFRESVAST